MNTKLSIKISVITFFLMLGVVLIHSYNFNFISENKNKTFWFLQNLISFELLNILVPFFFFISGYLFFLSFGLNNKEVNFKQFKKKITKRLRTLGIPYLFWCSFWFAFIYIIQILPFTKGIYENPLHEMTFWKKIWYLLLEPINYPFWYIRELILYILITPILFLGIKYLKFFPLIILFTLSLFQTAIFEVLQVDLYKLYMLFYFMLGSYCAYYKVSLSFKLHIAIQLLIFSFWIVSSAYITYFEMNNKGVEIELTLLSRVSIFAGCFSIWTLYDYLDQKFDFKHRELFSYSFFIYAMHGIPILMLKKVYVSYFKPSSLELMIMYFLFFLITAFISLYIGKILKKVLPNLYFFTTGNR